MGESYVRLLPSVDRLLRDRRIEELAASSSRQAVTQLVRRELEAARTAAATGALRPDFERMVESIQVRARLTWRLPLCHVVNATGVVLHTNLGRSPLSEAAVEAAALAARGYTDLEFDLREGTRGSRDIHLEALLREATGAEAALVVNNNAGAALLGLTALAKGREVIVSRGQAVEIGGGFRIPDVMRQSGARLVEVGTTNRTYLSDYEQAIGPRTAALLRVHTSNFRIVGFTESVPLADLVELGRKYGLLVLDDLGSGTLLATERFGLAHEPMVQESMQAGADLAFFSGDKLLGGPQAGIIVGNAEQVRRLRRHPLARALRIDKIDLAALAATLLHYARGEAESEIPVWRMITVPVEQLGARARGWAAAVPGAEVVPGRSPVGGGSLPEETLATALLALPAKKNGSASAQEMARRLRAGEPPVIARVERNRVLLDPRTVLPWEDDALTAAIKRAFEWEAAT